MGESNFAALVTLTLAVVFKANDMKDCIEFLSSYLCIDCTMMLKKHQNYVYKHFTFVLAGKFAYFVMSDNIKYLIVWLINQKWHLF